MTILREVGAERGQREILKDEAANQPGGNLQRHDGDGDDRHEADEAQSGRREDRRSRRQQDEQQHDAEDAGDLADARAQKAHDLPERSPQPDIVDGHDDLGDQIEKIARA